MATLKCVMLILPFVLLGCQVDTTKTYCQSGFKLTRMFKLMNRVYFGGKSKLFHYDLATRKQQPSSEAKDFGDTIRKVEMAVHFDLARACSPDDSNAGFCEHSRVYDGAVVLVGGGEMRMHRVVGDKLAQYTSPKGEQPSQESSQNFLPSIIVRLEAIVEQVFIQVAHNPMLKFTGLTYDHFSDKLYLAATVLQDNIINSDSWSAGKHVLFGSSFEHYGAMLDSFHVATFSQPVVGLIDYDGFLYVLYANNSIAQMRNGSFTGKTYQSAKVFLGCNGNKSPLSKPESQSTHASRKVESPGGNLGSLLFPSLQYQQVLIVSDWLIGVRFFILVGALILLLIGSVVVNGYTVYYILKEKVDDEGLTDEARSKKKSKSSRSR